MSLNLGDFRSIFEYSNKIDYRTCPNCFGEFWKWKIGIETESKHILDSSHVDETMRKLGPTLKAWSWNRPFGYSNLAAKLRKALEGLSEPYNQIRSYSLLDFSEIPNNALEAVWHELGCVKTTGGKNPSGYYLAMATTKPLMFLWGQTLAFDSVVRRHMPKFSLSGLSHNYWDFETWKRVMVNFQKGLKQERATVSLFKEVSLSEYKTDSFVPYGRFLDICYWRESKKCAKY